MEWIWLILHSFTELFRKVQKALTPQKLDAEVKMHLVPEE